MSKFLAFLSAGGWFAADYFSKLWALDALANKPIVVNDWMNFYLAFNRGAAFSFLSDSGGWQRWLFISLAVVVALYLVYALLFEQLNGLARLGYAAILGGAVGNLYDRWTHGHVIDFIQWHYQDYYWPTFNIADVAITVGVIAVIFASIFGKHAK